MTPDNAEAALRSARTTGSLLEPFTDTDPALDEEWGYRTQDADRAHRQGSGERMLGAKLGLTSAAKQHRMGVDRPIVGFLTADMEIAAEAVADRLGDWVQPRIEPEIAFITARDLAGPIDLSVAPRYVGAVLLAAEILDSRYRDYRFRLPDVVADNTSAAGVVLGAARHSLADLGDLAALHCEVRVDGALRHQATGAAILGEPLNSLVLLADHLSGRGQGLPAGSLVLAGALTDAEPLVPGHRYELSIDQLGTLRVGP